MGAKESRNSPHSGFFHSRGVLEAGQGPVPQQTSVLGLIYVALALLTDGAYAVLAGGLRRWLRGRFLQSPLPRYRSGGLHLGLGVKAALIERQP